jgi:multiple antibiotic resistance protein
MNFKDILTISMTLFAVIDIFGSVPIIMDLRRKVGHIESGKATWVSFVIMVLFLFLGENILRFVGIDVSSFAIAGSLIIFFLSLEMILGIRLYREDVPETASIVPIAFPLIAGAGTITTLISLRSEYAYPEIMTGIILNLGLVYAVLKNTARIEKFLGAGGLAIVRKVFGILLLAIAIKLFRSNAGI